MVHLITSEPDEALADLREAHRLNPNDVLIPGQAAHRFRDDVAYPFRLIAARHSD
jgi:hypothetical protein